MWIGPRIWKIASERGLYTVGDYLELRYGPSVRAVVAGIMWIATLAILAGQLIAAAWILDVVAGIPKPIGCLIARNASRLRGATAPQSWWSRWRIASIVSAKLSCWPN